VEFEIWLGLLDGRTKENMLVDLYWTRRPFFGSAVGSESELDSSNDRRR